MTKNTRDHQTLGLVFEAGGTVNALGRANQAGIEGTAAANRLVSLQKKEFVQRVERPHPAGDLFADPRSLIQGKTEAGTGLDSRTLTPNRPTVAAIEAARRGEVVEFGSPADALDDLNRED